MTGAHERWHSPEDFDVEDTDGAARFEQATRAAQAFAELPEAPPDTLPPDLEARSASSVAPLQANRVVMLMVVMVVAWLGFMVWDTWL